MDDRDDTMDTALMGMGIEEVSSDGAAYRVITPGARVVLQVDGALRVHQRIGVERELLALDLDPHLAPWRIDRTTPFRVRLSGNGLSITVQGDSVLIFEPQQNIRLRFALCFTPAYSEEAGGNRLLLDPEGGCGFFGIPRRPTVMDDNRAPGRSVACHLGRWDELWVSVCPPRPEDAKRLGESISHDIMYDLYDDRTMMERYPASETIREVARRAIGSRGEAFSNPAHTPATLDAHGLW